MRSTPHDGQCGQPLRDSYIFVRVRYDTYEMQVADRLSKLTVAFLEQLQSEQQKPPFAPSTSDTGRR
eukprot:COSAG05_NODE_311_length_11636_cov_11.922250_6_plen_67_part_00